jgi:hypothetical protein
MIIKPQVPSPKGGVVEPNQNSKRTESLAEIVYLILILNLNLNKNICVKLKLLTS